MVTNSINSVRLVRGIIPQVATNSSNQYIVALRFYRATDVIVVIYFEPISDLIENELI